MNKLERLERDIVSAKRGMVDWAEFFAKAEATLAVLKAKDALKDEEWPKDGDDYYTVSGGGDILRPILSRSAFDSHRLSTSNANRTKEETERYRDWLTNPRTQARRRVEMCDGFDVNGENVWKINHSGDLFMDRISTKWFSGGLSFATEEQAQACIDLLGEDVIKLALGVES